MYKDPSTGISRPVVGSFFFVYLPQPLRLPIGISFLAVITYQVGVNVAGYGWCGTTHNLKHGYLLTTVR